MPLVVIRRTGIWHRQLARLGREGNAAARRQRRDRAELRTHPSQQPGRHGRSALPVQGGRRRADPRSRRHRDLRSAGLETASHPRQDVTLLDPPHRRRARRSRSWSASTRRSRSTTTGTAASCPTCSVSSLRNPAASPDYTALCSRRPGALRRRRFLDACRGGRWTGRPCG